MYTTVLMILIEKALKVLYIKFSVFKVYHGAKVLFSSFSHRPLATLTTSSLQTVHQR